jgi:peptidyl-prolyl cis-trans isomerase D
LLIPSFIYWGASNRAPQFQKQLEAASVGDIEISADQLRQAVDRATRRMQAQSGGSIDPRVLRQLGVVDRALDDLVELALLSTYGRDHGMARVDDPVTLELVKTAIATNPKFQGAGGSFDPNLYDAFLRNNGFTEDSYSTQLRQIIAAAPIAVAVRTGAQAPKSLAETVYAYRAEQRVAQSLFIPDSSITDVPTPDDATITQFHKDNADRYQAPEYRALTIVRLNPEDRAGAIKITDDAVQAEYDARKAEFDVPAHRKVTQAVIADEALAKDLVAKVRQGTPFPDAVKAAINADPLDTGDFAKAADLQGALVNVVDDTAAAQRLADLLFAARDGDVTDPVKGPLGWFVFNLVNAEPAHTQTLADVHEKLVHDLAMRQAVSELIDVGNQLQDELASGTKLVDAATKFGLPVQKVEAVDQSGKAPDGKDVASVTGDSQLLSIAFETAEGDDSPLTDTASGGYVILHVDGVRPAATRPIEEVRDRVIADWQDAQRKKAAGTKAQDAAERIQGGEAIEKVAAELGAAVQTSQPFKRDVGDVSAGISEALAAKLFAIKIGDAATDRSIANDGEVVALLKEIRPADIAAAKTEVANLQKQLAAAISGDIYDQFNAVLKENIGVSKNQDVIDSLYK